MRLLLGAGALVEPPRIEHADTPLLVAVCNSHAHVARVLLEHGADVRACRRDGASVLHLACDDGHADLVSLLLQYGADVDAVDDKGMTPLWLSVGRGKEACALTLLQHACQVTARRGDGRPGIDVTRLPGGPTATPILHMAAQRWGHIHSYHVWGGRGVSRGVEARGQRGRVSRWFCSLCCGVGVVLTGGGWMCCGCWWRRGQTPRPLNPTARRPSEGQWPGSSSSAYR